MKQNIDIPLASAGITSPMWLAPLNEWMTLILVTGSIILVGMRIYFLLKEKNE